MAVTKTPKDVFRGDPVTALHEPDPRDVVTLLDEMREETEAAASANQSPVRSIRSYGVVGDGTDERAAIQAAMIEAADDGVSLFFSDGTYGIGSSGVSINGREYGLLLESGVRIIGESRTGTVFKALADIDLINTDRGSSHSDVEIRNLTLDGNEAALGDDPANGFNLWAYDIDGLVIDNVKSLNPASWGIRIQDCENVQMDQVVCDHSAETNSDGIHFIDTSVVTVGSTIIKSMGDDGFIIEAMHANVRDYHIGQVIVDTDNGLGIPARGFLLLGDESVMTGSRVISNIKANVVAKNCDGGALVLGGASYIACDLEVTARNCNYAMQLYPGRATYAGFAVNCSFRVMATGFVTGGISTSITNGGITGCHLEAVLSTSEATASGASIYGDLWSGDITATNSGTGVAAGISWFAQNSRVGVTSINFDRNLVVQDGATHNTFMVGRLAGGSTSDLEVVAGGTENTFIGGRVVGDVTPGATSTFIGVSGPNIP